MKKRLLLMLTLFVIGTAMSVATTVFAQTLKTEIGCVVPDSKPVVAAPVSAAIPSQARQEKLKIEFPKPECVVPHPYPKVSDLEPRETTWASSQERFLVPVGTKNLAKGKPVVSSDKSPIVGELNYITDGDKDGGEGFEVELAPGLQWVQIDLQQRREIYAIAIWHFHRGFRAYKAVIVQLSDDPAFKTGVTTVFNTDSLNLHKLGAGTDKHYIESHYGRILSVKGVKARYVRLYSAGNTTNSGNHYIEVEVHGK
jgi:hypothetical protein